MKTIHISRGAVVIVSDEDFDFLSSFNWSLNPQGTTYAVRKGRKNTGEPRTVAMHREIMKAPKGVQVDHINGNSLDNRRGNLRLADVQKNAFNRGKPRVECTSRYKGVLRRKNASRWEARVKYNGKAIHLGTFATQEEGARAYNYAATLMYGCFARLNEGVGEPPREVKESVYKKCLNMVEKRGWHPDTGVFFVAEEAAGNE